VVHAADGRAANPFESVLRAIVLDVPGLADLVDASLGLVIEAESGEFLGDRGTFDRDVRRYTSMVPAGWRVVRFVWADVMHDPDHVRAVLTDVVALARGGVADLVVRGEGR